MSTQVRRLVLSYSKEEQPNRGYTLVVNAGNDQTRWIRVIKLEPPKSRVAASTDHAVSQSVVADLVHA